MISECLRRRRRQVRVPVVEAQCYAANELQKTRSRAIGDLRHGRNDGEASDAVGAVLTDGVDMRGSGNLNGFLVGDANESAFAALFHIGAPLVGIFNNAAPRQYRIAVFLFCFPIHVH